LPVGFCRVLCMRQQTPSTMGMQPIALRRFTYSLPDTQRPAYADRHTIFLFVRYDRRAVLRHLIQFSCMHSGASAHPCTHARHLQVMRPHLPCRRSPEPAVAAQPPGASPRPSSAHTLPNARQAASCHPQPSAPCPLSSGPRRQAARQQRGGPRLRPLAAALDADNVHAVGQPPRVGALGLEARRDCRV